MNKPRTIEGRWWIHGEDKPPHFGVLNFDPEKGLKLSVKVPQERTVDEAFLCFIERAQEGRQEVPTVIHGADEHNRPVTLFACHCLGPACSAGLDKYEIHSIAAILNRRHPSWRESKAQTAGVRYSLLHNWMNRRLHEPMVLDGERTGIVVNRRQEFLTELSSGVHLRIEGGSFSSDHTIDCVRLDFEHRAWFHFKEPVSAQDVHEKYAGVFLRLLCLLTGQRVFAERITFFDDDPFEPSGGTALDEAELLQSCHGITEANRGAHSFEMVTSFDEIADDFETVVKRWFECHERLEPVVDLLLAVRSNRSSTIESQFLFFAQALEVYHARSSHFTSTDVPEATHDARVAEILKTSPPHHRQWLTEKLHYANQKTLATRIDEVLSLFPGETARLAYGIKDFASKVRHTRNYYTHYGEELRRKRKIFEGEELIRATLALEALLQICLLKGLGIQGKPITRILERCSRLEFASLDSGSRNPAEQKNADQPKLSPFQILPQPIDKDRVSST